MVIQQWIRYLTLMKMQVTNSWETLFSVWAMGQSLSRCFHTKSKANILLALRGHGGLWKKLSRAFASSVHVQKPLVWMHSIAVSALKRGYMIEFTIAFFISSSFFWLSRAVCIVFTSCCTLVRVLPIVATLWRPHTKTKIVSGRQYSGLSIDVSWVALHS